MPYNRKIRDRCDMKTPLLDKIPYEEFDYQTLLDAVRHYSQPRQKISHLLAQGAIVRVKKGLYVMGSPSGAVRTSAKYSRTSGRKKAETGRNCLSLLS